MLFYIFFILVVLIIALAVFHGVFRKVQFAQRTFQKSYVIFQNHQCKYQSVSKFLIKIMNSAQAHPILRNLIKTSKMNLFGLYYDNPHNLVNAIEARSTLGLIVQSQVIEDLDSEDRDKFQTALGSLKKEHQIDYREIPDIQSLWISFPYRSMLSYGIAPSKVYPSYMNEFKKGNYEIDFQIPAGCMESYTNNGIQFYFPMGVNRSHFYLTTMPIPEYQPGMSIKEQFNGLKSKSD